MTADSQWFYVDLNTQEEVLLKKANHLLNLKSGRQLQQRESHLTNAIFKNLFIFLLCLGLSS